MVTLLLVLLLAGIIVGNNQSKLLLGIGFIIFLVFDLAVFVQYLSNFSDAPDELVQQQERAIILEEQLDVLVSEFRYEPEQGDSVEVLYSFIDEYNTLQTNLEDAHEQIAWNERRLDPNSVGNKTAKFILDFGIIEKLMSYKQ